MREYFCGWYFKCQSNDKTLAVIAAYHLSKENSTCSIQLITDNGAWNAVFPYSDFKKQKNGFAFDVNKNRFGNGGMRLDIENEGLSVHGDVSFGALTPIKYDIMGPFKYVPFMQCRHSVVSMRHTVSGKITVNGEEYVFDNSKGYIEGDRGHSFPKVYSWTQCCFDGGSLMLSVADIPFGLFHFTGVIGVVYLNGSEYRIATYCGARAEKIDGGEIVIKQNDLKFTAKLIEKKAHPLYAPVGGAMTRTIRESASCVASYKLEKDGKTLLDIISDKASFEYEYPN